MEESSLKNPLIEKRASSESGYVRKEVVDEIKKQLWLAAPMVATNLLQFSLSIISVMFVGHLGELALSTASMATSFAAVSGYSLLTGMGSALDTLCGQSFGAKQYHMLGIQMQRAMVVLLLLSIPLAIIWAYTGSILLALGQQPDISEGAQVYARYMIPSLFAISILDCLSRFLQSQSNVFPLMLSSGITLLLHILLCWILVFKSGLGNIGAAVANTISYWINAILLALYVKFSPSCTKTWTGFSKEALHDLLSFIKLAIPSTCMLCLEWWAFEAMVLLSGLLPDPKLQTSVLSISLNTASTVWNITFGLSCAVSTRVSNELGAGRPRAARLAVYVVLVLAITEGLSLGLVLILIRNVWGYAYSNEIRVIQYISTMLPILALSHLIDGISCVLSGTARGCGWQKIGAIVNLGSYYLVGIPLAIVFAFVLHLGGRGLWMGIMCALSVQVISYVTITIRTNWDEEGKKAMNRVYNSIIPVKAVSQSNGERKIRHFLHIYITRAYFTCQ